MIEILQEIRHCKICESHLQSGVNPVLAAHADSQIVVIGQAPGSKVHRTGIPWNDPSGKNLRAWMNILERDFYNPRKVAIIPMGFCYPGKGKSGDLPPRKECAPQWHAKLFEHLKEVKLTLLVGLYAQQYYLGNTVKSTLTDTVKAYQDYLPEYLPLPHPSPRNNIWMKKNPWFKEKILPVLQGRVHEIID